MAGCPVTNEVLARVAKELGYDMADVRRVYNSQWHAFKRAIWHVKMDFFRTKRKKKVPLVSVRLPLLGRFDLLYTSFFRQEHEAIRHFVEKYNANVYERRNKRRNLQ